MNMNKEILLNLNAIEKVNKFTMISCTFNSDIYVFSGRYIVNAKSIMGVYSLDLSKPVLVKIDSANEEEIFRFNEVMEEFE